jgi:5'-3' exonuclease
MGIKCFFSWFKTKFGHYIEKVDYKSNINNIDHLMIDMNGLFHSSAQKVYEYGSYKPPKSLLMPMKKKKVNPLQQQLNVFSDICRTIENIVKLIKPNKKLILCVDGPAPLSKQNQQRQRRFMSAIDKESDTDRIFDSNCLTPGTKYMDHLTSYVDWFIRKQMNTEAHWKNIEVVFSNEKVPGEGEHKLIQFIRKFGTEEESYCMYGMDADLIMLALGTKMPNFYILREEPMAVKFDFYFIDIGSVAKELVNIMKWDDSSSERKFYESSAINDFIFMCFSVGNDFLPHIPGIEILSGSIDFMLDVYKNTCKVYGHLTRNSGDQITCSKKSLTAFLGTVSQYEQGVFTEKINNPKYFPDPIIEKNTKISEGKYVVDIEGYRKDYYSQKLNIEDEKDIEKVCHEYLKGMEWVINYYIEGVPDWKWRYPYHYAPFSFDIAQHCQTYNSEKFPESKASLPFIQLLSVLPPKSSELLPKPLDEILTKGSFHNKYCPEKFPIDLAGHRNTWEATVILPMVNYEEVEKLFLTKKDSISEKDKKLNIIGKSFIYQKSDEEYIFKSFYGDIKCNVSTSFIQI